MISHKEKVLTYLIRNNDKWFCDDCLSVLFKITPRQAINTICNKLKKAKVIKRYKGECSWCKKYKLINCASQQRNDVDAFNSYLDDFNILNI